MHVFADPITYLRYLIIIFLGTIVCDPHEVVSYGVVKLRGNKVGDTAVYTCDSEHILKGPKERVCTPKLQWSGSQPTCEPKTIGKDVHTV